MALLLSAWSPVTLAQMSINGRHLYSEAGERVILRGINEMFWGLGDRTGGTVLPEMAKTGANSVRIGWLSTVGTVADLDAAIGKCIQNKMIPMVEIHDATGDFSKLQICLDFWKRSDVISVMNKHKKWVLLNIANEAGNGSVTDDQFKTKYKDAITQLRNAGYTIPLIIDAANWGQNETQIINTWSEIFTHDPLKRVMFSVHTYWTSNQTARLDNLCTQVTTQNIPFVIGEGPQPNGSNCTTAFPYQYAMQKFQTNSIGWLVWSWGAVQNGDCNGGSAGTSGYDMTTNGVFGNWQNTWGRAVSIDDANSIQKTSVRPPSIVGTVTGTPTIRLEAENGTRTGVTVASSVGGYSGTGYIDGGSLDNTGDNVKVTANVSQAGTYPLTIRYNGRFGEKYQYIYVNGSLFGSVQFPAINGWASRAVGTIRLNAGNNTIELRKNYGWMDVDYFEIGSRNGARESPATTDEVGLWQPQGEFSDDGLSVFPNPTRGLLTVVFVSPQPQTATLQLLDRTGRTHQQTTHRTYTGTNRVQLSLPSLPTGVYLLSIRQTDGTLIRRVVID